MEKNDWQVIDTYSRKEAIADGVQVRIPDQIRAEAGIKFPVFVTETVWERYIKVPAGMKHQQFEGRIWDILTMFRHAARGNDSNRLKFKVHVQMAVCDFNRNEKWVEGSKTVREVELLSEIGAFDFDDPSPAITIFTEYDD
jgi:hypothetical protein